MHLSVIHFVISAQCPYIVKASFCQKCPWTASYQIWKMSVSCMQQWSTQVLSIRLKGFSSGSLSSLRYSHQMPLTQFRVLDPSTASALACGMAVEFLGRVSRLDQSIVSGLHVILKCQPYLFRVWIKGFAIAIC